jgi:hypothetical protein
MEKSKVILGLKKPSEFSKEERKFIIEEYLRVRCTKREIWHKYTGMNREKGLMLNWMRELGYNPKSQKDKLGVLNQKDMPKNTAEEKTEIIQLKEKINQLEKALVESELRAVAMETIIEVAQRELKINIKKKSYTKQSTR